MPAPIRIDAITARGRSRPGFAASPPSWVACSKPSRANTIPPDGSETRIEWIAEPWTKKPPPAVKLLACKWVASSTTIVSTGIATFQTVIALLARVSQRMPIRFSTTKQAIRTTATTIPLPLSVPLERYRPWPQSVVDRYWIAASTSIGAVAAACRYEAQPNVMPARLPNA